MSVTTEHGYPDWGRYIARADTTLVDVIAEPYAGVKTWDLGYVGNYEWFTFNFHAKVGPYKVCFGFGITDSPFVAISELNYEFQNGADTHVSVPILAGFCQVTITGTGASASYDLTITTAPHESLQMVNTGYNNVLISVFNAAIPAMTSYTHIAPRVWPGSGFWSVSCTAATWNASLSALSYTGGNTYFDTMTGNGTTESSHPIFLPSSNVRLSVYNGDAGARVYSAFLVGRPIGPGW